MIALLNGIEILPKNGSLRKSTLLVCFFIEIRDKALRLSFVPVDSWHRPRVEGGFGSIVTKKEKDYGIYFHSLHTSRKGCDP